MGATKANRERGQRHRQCLQRIFPALFALLLVQTVDGSLSACSSKAQKAYSLLMVLQLPKIGPQWDFVHLRQN